MIFDHSLQPDNATPLLRSFESRSVLEVLLIIDVVALAGVISVACTCTHFPGKAILGFFWAALFAMITWHHRQVEARTIRFDGPVRRLIDWTKASMIAVAGWVVTAEMPMRALPWIAAVFVIAALVFALIGMLARRAISRLTLTGAIGQRIAVYGAGGSADMLRATIAAQCGPEAIIDSIYDERTKARDTDTPGTAIETNFNPLIKNIKSRNTDSVVLNLPWTPSDRILQIKERLEAVNVNVCLSVAFAPNSLNFSPESSANLARGLHIYRRPVTGLEALAKLMLDKVLSIIALVLLLPVFVLTALAIWIESPGPVLFRQKRLGFNNEPFEMYKFRSMHQASEDRNAGKLVTKGDARVTRVGKIIRRTSIDELPQLINVLKGDMSLVGPRPHAYGAKAANKLYEEVVRRYPARHRARPGITGLAQVRGFRGNTIAEQDIENRVMSDIEYIDNWSLGLDIYIIAKTGVTFLFQKGAY